MKKLCLFVFLSVFCLTAEAASAHELALLPQDWQWFARGQELPVAVHSTHVFGISDAMEKPETVTLSYAGKNIPLTENGIWKSCDALVLLQAGGAAIIEALRAPQVWSEVDGEWIDGGRDVHPKAKASVRYVKYAKLLLPVEGKSEGFDRAVGHRLEIIPIDNPLRAKVGDLLRFRVLLDGKAAYFDEVRATYNGFSHIAGAWAWCSDPSSHGEATIKITHPGIWNVNAHVEVPAVSKLYEKENIRAVLTFPVR